MSKNTGDHVNHGHPPIESSSHDESDLREQVPVCLNCLTPHSPLQHYCRKCGQTVGQLTPYMPFLNIPFNFAIFDTMWKRIWGREEAAVGWRIFYVLLIFLCVPIMLLGLPFAIVAKFRKEPDRTRQSRRHNPSDNDPAKSQHRL